jgi:decaprenylphospho-beta-D-erythro-pentofuranosid-2-ulose 2-reductase
MNRFMVIGATSAIAQACCREWLSYAGRGAIDRPVEFFLVARSSEKLAQICSDLVARGAGSAKSITVDLVDFESHARLWQSARETLGVIDVVLIAHGTLPKQVDCEDDADLAVREFTTNGLVTIALLTRAATLMSDQGHGTIAAITSVAGDRGRPSNYLYGSAKAAVSTFCEGLRARMHRRNVRVVDVRPGFVATPMTSGLELPQLLVSSPEHVARGIIAGIRKGKDVVYAPWYWALIMWVIRSIPGPIFKRMSI